MRYILPAILFTAALLSLQAQAPVIVPSKMEVAGLRLKLNNKAKREIEETLNLLTQSQYYFQLKVDRSNLYMHFVEEVFRREGIPEDLKYLAIQEGEFVSDVVSSSGAVGFWQFKKASAQELGLRVDNVVDERKHIIASTVGAAKYLKRSKAVFDNWVLSLQSYLQGLGGTRRTTSDKWYGAKAMNITGKSHWYIKKFIAHKLAFQDFVGNGRKHKEIQLSVYEGKGKTLRQISRSVKLDYNELKRFNKWLKKSGIPNDKSYKVIYPVKGNTHFIAANTQIETALNPRTTSTKATKNVNRKASKVLAFRPLESNTGVFPRITGNISRAYEKGQVRVNGIRAIRAMAHETLQSLSDRTGIRISRLKRFNDIGDQEKIFAGKYYYLRRKRNKGRVHYHVVQLGETLLDIAQNYGIKLKKLRQKNRIRSEEPLKAGRILWLRFIRPERIPVEYTQVNMDLSATPAKDRPASEILPAKSETEKSPVEKEEENKFFAKSQPRKKLKDSATDTIIVHKVKPKESFFAIAGQYGVQIDEILEWNDLDLHQGLEIGQEVKLLVPRKYFEQQQEVFFHKVAPGQTLWAIAKMYEVSVEQLKKWNDKDTDVLSVGEPLKILKKKNR